MRGMDSYGMLCSASELGLDAKLLLPEQREGILLLAEDTPIGVDIKEVLGLDDVVYDFDLTANRGDCFNMIGLAREVAAVTGANLKMPAMEVKETAAGDANEMAKVEIKATDLCSRFAVRVLKNIKIKESPSWMQRRLRACGVRPISNVVDVTNYVMLELGQPMHAYDLQTLQGQIGVRYSRAGETLKLLDGRDDGLGFHQHARPAAKRAVVGGAMFIGAPGAHIMHVHAEELRLDRLAQDALGQKPFEHAREQRENVDLKRHE